MWLRVVGEKLEFWDAGKARCAPIPPLPSPQVRFGIPFLLGSLVHPAGIHVHHRIRLLGE